MPIYVPTNSARGFFVASFNAGTSLSSWTRLWDPSHFSLVPELNLFLPMLPSRQIEKYSRLIQLLALLLEGWQVGASDFIFRRKKQYGWQDLACCSCLGVPGRAFYCVWPVDTSPEETLSYCPFSLAPQSFSLLCASGLGFPLSFNFIWLLTWFPGWSPTPHPTAWGLGVFNSALVSPQLFSTLQESWGAGVDPALLMA